MYNDIASDLAGFIENSPSVFHVIRNLSLMLSESGYHELREQDAHWDVRPGGKYFVTRNASSLLSFTVPEGPLTSILGIAAHSDSPTFRIKPDPEMESAGCVRLNIEPYGGMLKSTWYDRPLTVAGRVLVQEDDGISQRLVHVDRDLLIIPSLAIHMDRDANDKAFSNVQKDMPPLFTLGESNGHFQRIIAKAAGLPEDEADRILGSDLFLVNRTKPVIWGREGEFISAPKLDDLMCCYGAIRGFIDASADKDNGALLLCGIFDNEEVGSHTRQGAGSTFFTDVTTRLQEALGISRGDLMAAAARGMMLSADNAHAVHPNHTDKADPVNRPVMNGGIVLKLHANQKYTTDGISQAQVKRICRKYDIPIQTFVNRSDMAGGSTLGNILNTQFSISTADIGLAQLAMHSAYETAGTKDIASLAAFTRRFLAERLPDPYCVS